MKHSKQAGASLLFALIALVALSLAAIAVVRSVDTNTVVLGNLGFKQEATSLADTATQDAISWLDQNQNLLTADNPDNGYYASVNNAIDVTGQKESVTTRDLIDWDGDNCAAADEDTYDQCAAKVKASEKADVEGNQSRYVIFRLCSTTGDPDAAGNTCMKPITAAGSGGSDCSAKKGELTYAEYARFCGTSGPYYRIVVRVEGARSTTSYTETIVHF